MSTYCAVVVGTPALRTFHANFDFLYLFAFELEARAGTTNGRTGMTCDAVYAAYHDYCTMDQNHDQK